MRLGRGRLPKCGLQNTIHIPDCGNKTLVAVRIGTMSRLPAIEWEVKKSVVQTDVS